MPGTFRGAFLGLVTLSLGLVSVVSAAPAPQVKSKVAGTKNGPENSHQKNGPAVMIILNGSTFFQLPVAKFPSPSVDFKNRKSIKLWIVKKETIEKGGSFNAGKSIAEVKVLAVEKIKPAPSTEPDDCGITESWLGTSTRIGQDPSLSPKVKNEKSISYWNIKGFEIPDGFELVDTKTETKLTDSMLLELVNKSNGEMWMAAEFKNGESRLFVVPESSTDEFRSFFNIYLKTSATSGLNHLKRFDFVESCP